MGGGTGCLSASHEHCSVFLTQSYSSALKNATQLRGWVAAWLKPLLGLSFTVLYLISLLPHPLPFS